MKTGFDLKKAIATQGIDEARMHWLKIICTVPIVLMLGMWIQRAIDENFKECFKFSY